MRGPTRLLFTVIFLTAMFLVVQYMVLKPAANSVGSLEDRPVVYADEDVLDEIRKRENAEQRRKKEKLGMMGPFMELPDGRYQAGIRIYDSREDFVRTVEEYRRAEVKAESRFPEKDADVKEWARRKRERRERRSAPAMVRTGLTCKVLLDLVEDKIGDCRIVGGDLDPQAVVPGRLAIHMRVRDFDDSVQIHWIEMLTPELAFGHDVEGLRSDDNPKALNVEPFLAMLKSP
ncbi:MAG: hypothetical protein ACLFOY_19625 [Desulfatibacillaceae bacterium]